MIAPSTIASGGTGSLPKATTRKPFPAGRSSTALTALEPMSRPTTAFCVRNKPTDGISPTAVPPSPAGAVQANCAGILAVDDQPAVQVLTDLAAFGRSCDRG